MITTNLGYLQRHLIKHCVKYAGRDNSHGWMSYDRFDPSQERAVNSLVNRGIVERHGNRAGNVNVIRATEPALAHFGPHNLPNWMEY